MLLYEAIGGFKSYLLTNGYSPRTVKTYCDRLAGLLKEQDRYNLKNGIDFRKILEDLAKVKYKNHFSQYKNSLLKFAEFQKIDLPQVALDSIEEIEKQKKKKYRNLKATEYKKVDQSIKHLKNKKMKTSFQVMLSTGLRVFELEQISPSSCQVSAEAIEFQFVGKGGKVQKSNIKKSDDLELYQKTKELIEQTPEDKKLFYSAVYLQRKAKTLGFACHDLRRICSKLEYKKTKNKEAVKLKLRHTSIKTSNIYLRSKVKI